MRVLLTIRTVVLVAVMALTSFIFQNCKKLNSPNSLSGKGLPGYENTTPLQGGIQNNGGAYTGGGEPLGGNPGDLTYAAPDSSNSCTNGSQYVREIVFDAKSGKYYLIRDNCILLNPPILLSEDDILLEAGKSPIIIYNGEVFENVEALKQGLCLLKAEDFLPHLISAERAYRQIKDSYDDAVVNCGGNATCLKPFADALNESTLIVQSWRKVFYDLPCAQAYLAARNACTAPATDKEYVTTSLTYFQGAQQIPAVSVKAKACHRYVKNEIDILNILLWPCKESGDLVQYVSTCVSQIQSAL